MKLTERMVLEVAAHEAIVTQTYRDSEGVLTWALGVTNSSGHRVERYIGNPQPLQVCIDVSVWLLQKYLDEVVAAFAPHKLTETQAAGALSFHWNTGAISTATWVKDFKNGLISKARESFMLWKKPAAIIDRRKKELALFFDGKWSYDGATTVITGVTASMTPNWKIAKRVNILKEVNRALGGTSDDNGIGVKPTPTPDPTLPTAPGGATNLFQALADLLKRIFGK